jgi:hypothetical protein
MPRKCHVDYQLPKVSLHREPSSVSGDNGKCEGLSNNQFSQQRGRNEKNCTFDSSVSVSDFFDAGDTDLPPNREIGVKTTAAYSGRRKSASDHRYGAKDVGSFSFALSQTRRILNYR